MDTSLQLHPQRIAGACDSTIRSILAATLEFYWNFDWNSILGGEDWFFAVDDAMHSRSPTSRHRQCVGTDLCRVRDLPQ
jgi:hypothetical protein